MGPKKSNSSYSFDRPETIRDRAKKDLAGHRDRTLSENYFEPWSHLDMFAGLKLGSTKSVLKYRPIS